MSPMHAPPGPDTDSAIVLGMASTAIAFASTPQAEAERWLRILRLHGRAGVALQALGVSEAPIEAAGAPAADARPDPARAREIDVVAAVTERAVETAARRGAQAVDTSDVLVAAMDVYGEDFERVLRMHGTDRREVLERLDAEQPPRPADG
jgi:hypothetical protein